MKINGAYQPFGFHKKEGYSEPMLIRSNEATNEISMIPIVPGNFIYLKLM